MPHDEDIHATHDCDIGYFIVRIHERKLPATLRTSFSKNEKVLVVIFIRHMIVIPAASL